MKRIICITISLMMMVVICGCGKQSEAPTIVNSFSENNDISNESSNLQTHGASVPKKMCGDNAYWDFQSGILTISGSGDLYDYYVSLDPNSVQTSWISDIPWFEVKHEITEVVIGSGITGIGDNSFRGCYSMQTVSMPDSLQSIGEYAFAGCFSVEAIIVPDSVQTIGERAFWNSGIKKLVLGSGVENCGALICLDCSNLESVTFKEGIKSIGEKAFYDCSNISKIELPDGLKHIGEAAFCQCSSVREIVIGQGLTEIPANLFDSCKSETLVIPEGVTSIGIGVFYGNKTLTSVTLPSTLTSIGKYAFTQCGNLKDVDFNGTKEQWQAIRKDKGNDCLTKASIHFN